MKGTSYYYPLFKHMMEEHNLTLLDCEMDEIVQYVNEMQRKAKEVPVGLRKETRCCGMCDGHHDECVADMICAEHKVQGCEVCWPHPDQEHEEVSRMVDEICHDVTQYGGHNDKSMALYEDVVILITKLKKEWEKERDELVRWKKETLAVSKPFLDFVLNHPSTRLGDSCHQRAIDLIRERDELLQILKTVNEWAKENDLQIKVFGHGYRVERVETIIKKNSK